MKSIASVKYQQAEAQRMRTGFDCMVSDIKQEQ
jgi:hypothetical protein